MCQYVPQAEHQPFLLSGVRWWLGQNPSEKGISPPGCTYTLWSMMLPRSSSVLRVPISSRRAEAAMSPASPRAAVGALRPALGELGVAHAAVPDDQVELSEHREADVGGAAALGQHVVREGLDCLAGRLLGVGGRHVSPRYRRAAAPGAGL